MRIVAVLALLVTAACGDDVQGEVTIVVPPAWSFAVGEMAALTPYRGLVVETADHPVTGPHVGFQIVVVDDDALPQEAYRVDPGSDPTTYLVHAHDVLGAQYGVASALEGLGFRFRHPYDPLVPAPPRATGVGADTLGVVHAPEVRVRGLQLHTLHPIEGYFAFWEPGHEDEAHRVIDWVVKNRGNYLQWVALDNILDPVRHAEWQAYTRGIIDYAHARGVRVGLNIQLFGQSNLQLAFDLSDDQTGTVPIATEIAGRLPFITDGVPFDVYDLSFGEFFGAEPPAFVAAIDEVVRQLRERAPAAEIHAVVHVGATQRVTFMGEDMIYYFLVRFADPSIVPDIHTVMYYDLFEDAGGAYHHSDFSEHRAYLEARMCAGQKAAYFPETAYWIAFDNSIPTFVPLYAHSRWLDLARLAASSCGPLDEHLIFSSGWEWGYWLGDVVALRSSFEHPADPRAATRAELAGDLGEDAAALVDDVADAQHDALIDGRLAPYFASRDVAIDVGRRLDIISQPDRVTFEDLAAMMPDQRDAFAAATLSSLDALADTFADLAARAERLQISGSRWSAEITDGIAIDRERARFVAALYHATVAHLAGDAAVAEAARATAAARLESARGLIARRHRDLHDPDGHVLVEKTGNNTFYQYGYLYMADTMCYWQRELSQVDALMGDTSTMTPGCLF